MIWAKFTLPLLAVSALANHAEYRATLFGNPCVLKGPAKLGESGLKQIHLMGPEKIPLPSQLEETKKHLANLKKITGTPAQLDRYKDLLIKRLSAQQAFFEGLVQAKKNRKTEPLIAAVKPFQKPDRAKRFESQLNKLEKESGNLFWAKLVKDDSAEDLALVFADSVDPMPEEEFHKALTKMGVTYDCSFEAPVSNEEEDDLED